MNNFEETLPILETPKRGTPKEKVCPERPLRKRRNKLKENELEIPFRFPVMEDFCNVDLYNRSLANIRNFLGNLDESKKEHEIERLRVALGEL
tara:strand:+ start:2546 stop:2824 length:279 start_codon:yes stop_codon:yes gene_type:complete